ncbi:MAG: hypothetical protein J4O04_08915 [Chloroflexi bacterium]|nr:hypothetical protein [Chloroflexota bacterium]
MLRARLPWLFTALAVASPFLWLWFFVWSANSSENQDSELAGLSFVLWIITSFIFVILFVTLAALTSRPMSKGMRSVRRLILFLFGGTSLLIGLVTFMLFVVIDPQNLGVLLSGIGMSALFIGSGIIAGRELLSTRGGSKTSGYAEAAG